MLFSTQKRIKDQSLNIQHHFNSLSYTSTYKYLGVKLDQTLALRDYVESAYKKASGRLYLLKRARHHLTIDALVKLYKCMILAVFTYCSMLTNIFTKSFEEKVSKFEKRAYAIIYKHLDINNLEKVLIRTLRKRRLCEQGYLL